MTIEFTIPGAPQGKERPRFTKNGIAYTPARTKEYEKLVSWAYKTAAHGVMLSGPVRAKIVAVYKIPHSWSKRKQAEAEEMSLLPLTRPDLDNVAKAVLDALNGIAYKDDSSVVDLRISKCYGAIPCVAVLLSGEVEKDG